MDFAFLIDECLSPELVQMARDAGHGESTCVRDRGWSGKKDWEIASKCVTQNFTLVTHNARDFRGGGADDPGGEYATQDVHPGLVCLTAPNMSLTKQRAMFQLVLDEAKEWPDLVNQVCEVFELPSGEFELTIYDFPDPP